MGKRLFQILDEMNVNDTNNGTDSVGVCNELIEARTVKAGGHVTIGVPANVIRDMFIHGDKQVILLVIDKKEYERIKSL